MIMPISLTIAGAAAILHVWLSLRVSRLRGPLKVGVGDGGNEVIHCPGHTPGHVVFFHRGAQFAFVGDVIFEGSIGRTDFPMGNHQDLIDAITTRLWPLGDETAFVPGHGPMSTFGQERRTNPFVGDQVLARV